MFCASEKFGPGFSSLSVVADAIKKKYDRMLIIGDSIRRAETLIRLSIDPKMAGLPYTTKCSPNSIIFAGAEARLKLKSYKKNGGIPYNRASISGDIAAGCIPK